MLEADTVDRNPPKGLFASTWLIYFVGDAVNEYKLFEKKIKIKNESEAERCIEKESGMNGWCDGISVYFGVAFYLLFVLVIFIILTPNLNIGNLLLLLRF